VADGEPVKVTVAMTLRASRPKANEERRSGAQMSLITGILLVSMQGDHIWREAGPGKGEEWRALAISRFVVALSRGVVLRERENQGLDI